MILDTANANQMLAVFKARAGCSARRPYVPKFDCCVPEPTVTY